MKRILLEPLVHFLLAGAALFALYQWASDSAERPSDSQILVNPGRVEQFATVFAKTWQRPPTREELQGLVDDYVLEEIYYRQAVAMGIDRNDTVIRRRLRQKLEFLTDDATSLADPTDEQLETFLRENESRFRQSHKYTFRQIYFNPEKHGEDPEGFLLERRTQLRRTQLRRTQLRRMQTGQDATSPNREVNAERGANEKLLEGDPSLLPESFQTASVQEIDRNFGLGFASQLEPLSLETWEGPLQSGMGAHLVRIEAREEGRMPQLDEIRNAVEREWRNKNRLESREALNASLRDQYEVIVEWPQSIEERLQERTGEVGSIPQESESQDFDPDTSDTSGLSTLTAVGALA